MRLIAAILIVFVLIASACSSAPTAVTPTPIYSTASEATLKPGDPIPAPEGDPVLTVSGKIGVSNFGSSIEMDLKTIESVGQVEYTVVEPFGNERITYRGPLVSSLLDVWQVPDDATELTMTALDDYSVTIPISELRTYPVLFALQANGVYMPLTERGPAMFVWPYDHFEFEPAVYNDYWIWQIKSAEVR